MFNPLTPPHGVRIAKPEDLFLGEIILPGHEYLIQSKKSGCFVPMKTFKGQSLNMLKDAIGEGRVYVNK